MNTTESINFDNSYARLPDRFFSHQTPTPVAAPELLCLNKKLAVDLGLDPIELASQTGVAMLAGNQLPGGAQPIAMAYAGHQFGGWVPQLGDGRAILLGELINTAGKRLDIQLKGAGRTPYSRGGDGRAWLGPVLREYIVSETMAAYGIPTTRALAAVTTGELVRREADFPGAILTRVAGSHIRVGTFEFFAARKDEDGLRVLADYVIDRHYPELKKTDNRFAALLAAVLDKQAYLVSRWQGVGFIHGVMNTDNMSVSGDTIDYGPCAFMDAYDPKKVFSSIDQNGRYAYQNQPAIAQWNLAVLAQSLLPLIDNDNDNAVEQAQSIIDSYPTVYEAHYLTTMRAKFGLLTEQTDDLQLIISFLKIMADTHADFTNTFRLLSRLPGLSDGQGGTDEQQMGKPFESWLVDWRQRLRLEHENDKARQQSMSRANPAYIPRNHQIESVIQAGLSQNFAPLNALLDVLAEPFSEQAGAEQFASPPKADEEVYQTFCGT